MATLELDDRIPIQHFVAAMAACNCDVHYSPEKGHTAVTLRDRDPMYHNLSNEELERAANFFCTLPIVAELLRRWEAVDAANEARIAELEAWLSEYEPN